ncbi:GNAT family N-acetyltransferase [Subtercola boreus]|uniref:N-acetyltransferase domain-containing protein n=1 Tax=Subtercola boreus TaxID=120213 RepID=A0A3E0W983_9MICO|nr:GNAT family N-acetyltransferase [Subtercola boreus]RFA19271.1 hypothetical protein B7R24_11465 [Subtercola boreus]RFA19531.1 hypothetical protein B7R23_11445 [Subtercola boreus]RFA25897.1 hypothetical protein B7R25_11565 [Subtercola boreus]
MIRRATPADLDLLLSARQHDPVALVDEERFRRELDLGQYRFEWSFVDEVEGRLRARALWWGPPEAEHPISLDCVWVDPAEADPTTVAAQLVRAGHQALFAAGLKTRPDFIVTVDPAWRKDPDAVVAAHWRTEAVARAGLTERIERLSYAWTPADPLPARSTRLTFDPADDSAFLDVFAQVAQQSLDLLTLQNLRELGAEAQAADDLEFYLSLPGDRGLWRLARNAERHLVGFVIPSRSAYDASVSYLGVVPGQRGHGFVDDLLAEITHVHAANGAPRITATTDTTNAPMAAAFLRNGYRITKARLVFTAPTS